MMTAVRATADLAWTCFIIGPLLLWLVLRQLRYPHQKRWSIAAVGLSILAVLCAASTIIVTLTDLDPTKPLVDRVSIDVLPMMTSALFIGFLLYWFRRSDRALYGIAEIGFGAMTAGYAAWSPDPSVLPRVLALGAAVYIVVRGLDNIDAGKLAGSKTGQWLTDIESRNSPEGKAERRGKS
jgi:peptidoglycan/LPS O-acetylase OafA/YrhL